MQSLVCPVLSGLVKSVRNPGRKEGARSFGEMVERSASTQKSDYLVDRGKSSPLVQSGSRTQKQVFQVGLYSMGSTVSEAR